MYLSMLLLDIDSYYKNLEELGDNYFAGYPESEKQLILKIRDEYEPVSYTHLDVYKRQGL